jgi:hypothetical protein
MNFTVGKVRRADQSSISPLSRHDLLWEIFTFIFQFSGTEIQKISRRDTGEYKLAMSCHWLSVSTKLLQLFFTITFW